MAKGFFFVITQAGSPVEIREHARQPRLRYLYIMQKVLRVFLPQIVLIVFALGQAGMSVAADSAIISSPGGNIRVVMSLDKKISYRVYYQGETLMRNSYIDMELMNGKKLNAGGKFGRISRRTMRSVIVSPVPEKRRLIPDIYNEADIDLRNGFSIGVRVYDDGFAYRISSRFKDSIVVRSETATFQFDRSHTVYCSESQGGRQDIFHTSFEEPYLARRLDSLGPENLLFNPLVVAPEQGPKIAIAESDVEDYPGMFLTGSHGNELAAKFAPYPAGERLEKGEYSQVVVDRREVFIARCAGVRNFPWRVIIIAAEDRELPENDLVYRLASPSRLKDHSWITPMQSTDEWIISSNLFNVGFKSGINTDTYKYYIDFAKRFGIESVMMDAGWSDNHDLFSISPGIDMEEILRYARSKGIRINMWTLAWTLERQLEPALARFNRWGVGFIMTDFFDRDDQVAVARIKKIAEACARHRIMIMFHGAPKPAGFNRTYPHAVTREGVLGSEFNIWSEKATPWHNVTIPFTRMLAGPMDYEPGLLRNATSQTFRPIPAEVMSFGTRTNQLAMYVVYDSPIQFFSGNPSQGMLEPGFMDLLGAIPTVWDTTIVLDARLANFIVTARKSGDDWFVGAMTDSVGRDLTIPLSFVGPGEFQATVCEDGLNADRHASDYHILEKRVVSTDHLEMRLQPGGGYFARLRKL